MKICIVRIKDISEKELNELSKFISIEKRAKIEKFTDKKDKIRALVGEFLVKVMVSEALGIEIKDVIFETNHFGKPYLKYFQEINFNISHSGDFVLCCISENPVGIDIEHIQAIKYSEIIENFFTASEVKYINEGGDEASLNKFYEIWTLKESYIKCLGTGLSTSLKSFSIDINQSGIKEIINEYGKYFFERFEIDSEYKAAICSLDKVIDENIIYIDQKHLINDILR